MALSNQQFPGFIRAVEEVRGVRIVRLQGPVGMQIGQEEHLTNGAEPPSVNPRAILASTPYAMMQA
jgi:hypothetical protein